ncbi:GspH/FimT family pseudopilin [Brevundimonas sp.]|uniref:GspH/FimT family pseudopilin n=1 Tax=Brevundimonas sp. TaxID=1871086 RepID=UPI00356A843D
MVANGRALKPDERRQGMTLIEMLVVLAIIGVSASLLVLGGGLRGTTAQTEANRLADRLRLAADEALIDGRPMRLRLAPSSYEFIGGDADALRGRHILPKGVVMSAQDAEVSVDPDGAAPPSRMTIRDRGQTFIVTFDGLGADVVAVADGART